MMSPPPAAPRRLNVLQVCDHLGWEGSRMHGVKRLFAWMIPRFDPDRYNVSLVSLRRKDLSEETLDSFGIDITYLHRTDRTGYKAGALEAGLSVAADAAGAAQGDRPEAD